MSDPEKKEGRYIRWQGYAIGQLTFALNLFLGISVGSLAFGITLVRDDQFVLSGCSKTAFGLGLGALALSVFGGCAAVVSRLFDFRITAAKVRAEEKGDPADSNIHKYRFELAGKWTWFLFWFELASLLIGLIGLIVGLCSKYGEKVW